MIELTKENFGKEVLEAEGLVFVDFWSTICMPCKALKPKLEAFVEKNKGKAKFCALEVMANKGVARPQGILSVPSIAFYRGGKQLLIFTPVMLGELGMEGLQEKLDEFAGA